MKYTLLMEGGENMLIKPTILKVPDANYPKSKRQVACASSGYTGCKGQFNCSSYQSSCIDVSHSCSKSLAGGIAVGGAVAYTAGVFITGAIVT